jgi:hypothetical protein
MAKTQNLSLNPTKISGTCGRLMCCLKYEQDAYEDLLKTTPKNESFVDTPDGRGTVIEVDLLRQRVKVRLEAETETAVWHKNEDIAVLRSGKAKKTDLPIPADLAPISGGGKWKKAEKEEENTRYLDSIRLRYSEETIADETTSEVAPQPEEENKEGRRNNRRSRRHKAAKEMAAEVSTPKVEKPAAPKETPSAEAAAPEKKRNHHHRRYHRHKKPGGNENN